MCVRERWNFLTSDYYGITGFVVLQCQHAASALLQYVNHLNGFWDLKLLRKGIEKEIIHCVHLEITIIILLSVNHCFCMTRLKTVIQEKEFYLSLKNLQQIFNLNNKMWLFQTGVDFLLNLHICKRFEVPASSTIQDRCHSNEICRLSLLSSPKCPTKLFLNWNFLWVEMSKTIPFCLIHEPNRTKFCKQWNRTSNHVPFSIRTTKKTNCLTLELVTKSSSQSDEW